MPLFGTQVLTSYSEFVPGLVRSREDIVEDLIL